MASAPATASALRPPNGRSSAPRSPISADSFGLDGPSEQPDPAYHAYRRDLADIALAGRVIASHYAKPLATALATAETLRSKPSDDADALAGLAAGERFAIVENSRGWAWGYAGADCRVGYVRAGALALL